MTCSFLVRKDRKEKAHAQSTPYPYLMKLTKIDKRAFPYARDNSMLRWQSPVTAKDLSPFYGGSNPLLNNDFHNSLSRPKPPDPYCVRTSSCSPPYASRTKSTWLHTTTKRPQRRRPLWPSPTNCRWIKTLHKRARPPFNLFSFPLLSNPNSSPDSSPYLMNPHAPPLPHSRPKPWYFIYPCSFQPRSLLNSRVRLSLKFKIRPNRGTTSRRPNDFL